MTERVRVTGPRRETSVPRRPSVRSEIDSETELGTLYMRALIRSQLRLALEMTAVVVGTLGALPLVFRVVPWTRDVRVLGVPLPWLLLGVVVYPCLVLAGWVFVRRAERNEHAFSDLVDQ